MKDKIEAILNKIDDFKTESAKDIEQFRIDLLGKKGEITSLFAEFKTVSNELKRELGKDLNILKQKAQAKVEELKSTASDDSSSSKDANFDFHRPADLYELGSRHPLSLVREEIIEIFNRIGFTVSEGPEIEDDWHNFSALNFPPEHPARDMQDTFFIEKGENEHALRTHTSSVQVRMMENNQPPIRTISPGRVFRNEAISARAHCIFIKLKDCILIKMFLLPI